MSINVTVNGNPVNIKKGKMVCYDANNCKKEFDKRRLMRLEQVRQQSKEIAEDLRKKVRREKCKQLCEIEKEGKEKLKKWQAKKLLELQNQYKEAVENIGLAHKEAELGRDDSEILLEEKERNDRISRDRGQKAAEKLQIEKNEANYVRALPRQQRKLVREIEDTRSALVSGLHKKGKSPFKKKKKRKTPKAEAKRVNDYFQSDSEDQVPRLDIESSQTSEVFDCECPSSSLSSESSGEEDSVENSPRKNHEIPKSLRKSPKKANQEQQTSATLMPKVPVPVEEKSVQAIPEEVCKPRLEIPLDTRISDRIRSRNRILSQPDYCDTIKAPVCTCDDFTRPPCFCRTKPVLQDKSTTFSDTHIKRYIDAKPSIENELYVRKSFADEDGIHRKLQGEGGSKAAVGSALHEEIPAKPKIVLETSKDKLSSVSPPSRSKIDSVGTPSQSKVDYYDHHNRLSKGFIDDRSQVEKIGDESLRVSPGTDSDIQYYDRVYKRDRDAQIRGQKALEKERIHKEYKELLKKLPALQRQERICEISNDKPEYHMSEERLQERERRRQHRMDNAYEKSFPQRKPAVVTIPKKIHDKDVHLTPFVTVETDKEGSPVLNVGQWDVESKPPEAVRTNKEEEKSDKIRKEQLKELLDSLQNQKKMLLEEIKALPKDSKLNELLEDLSNMSMEKRQRGESRSEEHISQKEREVIPQKKKTIHESRTREKSKRRASPDELESPDITVDSSKADTERSLSREERYRKRHEKCFTSESAVSAPSPSPRKKAKMKYKKRMRVLENNGTQTSPTLYAPMEVKQTGEVQSHREKSVTEKVRNHEDVAEVGKTIEKPAIQVSDTEQTSEKILKSDQVTSNMPDGNQNAKRICPKKHIPCDCTELDIQRHGEDLCQIVIKIKDNEKPEILVHSPDKNKVAFVKDDSQTRPSITELTSKGNIRRSDGKKHKRKDKADDRGKEKKSSVSEQISSEHIISHEEKIRAKADDKPNKPKSWREQFRKNSSGETTATSYYSPPDFVKLRSCIPCPQAQSSLTDTGTQRPKPKLHDYDDLLKQRPQQQNLYDSVSSSNSDFTKLQGNTRRLDPKLVTYIKKLITMSRKNVNDLGVSTVSEVSTPSQSIIDIESNKPINRLCSIMKYFNLNAADLQQHLSYSSDGSSTHVQAQESLVLSSSEGSQVFSQNMSIKSIDVQNGGCSRVQDLSQVPSQSSFTKNIKKYTEIAESCNKRISNLNAMIQQVRDEKMKILESPVVSEPDQSTKYMNLPCSCSDNDKPEEEDKKSTSSVSTDKELEKKLLEIDLSLSEKLKRMSSEEIKQYEASLYNQIEEPVSNVSMSESDKQLFMRLQKLLDSSNKTVKEAKECPAKKSPKDKTVAFTMIDTGAAKSPVQIDESGEPFIPLLLDIPKLPKLTVGSLNPEMGDMNNHRRPPVSKGLSIIGKISSDTPLVPHELSTIIEADSQLSTRLEQSPKVSKVSIATPHKTIEEVTCGEQDKGKPKKSEENIPVYKSPERIPSGPIPDENVDVLASGSNNGSGISISESDKSLADMLKELNKSLNISKDTSPNVADLSHNLMKSSNSSSDNKSDLEALEKMLHSIGMDWAITTLRKTKEALALSSSSSSLDLKSRNKSKSKSSKSPSETTLKEFLAQQLVSKISSSTLKSDASDANSLGESQELSTIHNSLEKINQRTSTPVQSNSQSLDKSKGSQKAVFTGESDLSSVKNSSQEMGQKQLTFHSLSETSSHS